MSEAVHYLFPEDLPTNSLTDIFNFHNENGGCFYVLPGNFIYKMFLVKPGCLHGTQIVQCNVTGDWHVELQIISETGRLITLTSRGYTFDGQQYFVEI